MAKAYGLLSEIYIGYGLLFLTMGCILRAPIVFTALVMLGAGVCSLLCFRHPGNLLFAAALLLGTAALAANIRGSFIEPEVFIVPSAIQAALLYLGIKLRRAR